jgi:hypothetical protein
MAKKVGRPRIELDWVQAEALMRMNPTLADTAAFFKCGQTTIEERIREEYDLTFKEFRNQNMVHTRLNLVRKAMKMAEKNPTMMIFCLKNLCKWVDKHETEVTNKEIKIDVFSNENPLRKDKQTGSAS